MRRACCPWRTAGARGRGTGRVMWFTKPSNHWHDLPCPRTTSHDTPLSTSCPLLARLRCPSSPQHPQPRPVIQLQPPSAKNMGEHLCFYLYPFPCYIWYIIQAPVLVVVVILFAILIWFTSHRGWFSGILNGIPTPEGFMVASSTGSNSRELTAEQLAGSINRNTSANGNAAGAATPARTRRNRRARRTPSQISTTSLPAYMKEPGEQELVIIR